MYCQFPYCVYTCRLVHWKVSFIQSVFIRGSTEAQRTHVLYSRRCLWMTHRAIVYYWWIIHDEPVLINPWRTCTARVTAALCVCVCLSVCPRNIRWLICLQSERYQWLISDKISVLNSLKMQLWHHLLTAKATSPIAVIQSSFLRRHRVIKLLKSLTGC